MQVAIAGGSGFIGRALVRHLSAVSDYQLTVIGRNPAKLQRLFKTPIHTLSWTQLKQSPHQLSLFDAVINLCGESVGAKRWSDKRKQVILDSRLMPTRWLVEQIVALGSSAPRLLNASAIGVYGLLPPDQQHRVFDELTEIDFSQHPDFLSTVARQWEALLSPLAMARHPAVALRFAVVIGPEGGALAQMRWPFYLGLGGPIGSGQQPFTWVSLCDVCRMIHYLLQHPQITGPVNIVSPQVLTQRDFAHHLATGMHRPSVITLPAVMVKCLFGKMGEELLLSGVRVKSIKLSPELFEYKHNIDKCLRSSLKRAG